MEWFQTPHSIRFLKTLHTASDTKIGGKFKKTSSGATSSHQIIPTYNTFGPSKIYYTDPLTNLAVGLPALYFKWHESNLFSAQQQKINFFLSLIMLHSSEQGNRTRCLVWLCFLFVNS
jgi:hypothetical protein